jgi:hypothetical protein
MLERVSNALDARSGKVLWKFKTGSGIHSNPVTYSVNGKQYVAVPTGWGGWLKGFSIDTFGASRGTALVVPGVPGGELASMDLIFIVLIAEAASHALGANSHRSNFMAHLACARIGI